MTRIHPTGLVYRDPLCHIQDPDHRCRRRDGRPLTSPFDGDCWDQARIDSIADHPATPRQPREHAVPCRVCHRNTWNSDALCSPNCHDLYHFYAVIDVDQPRVVCRRLGCGALTGNPDGYCSTTCRVLARVEHIDWDYDRGGFCSLDGPDDLNEADDTSAAYALHDYYEDFVTDETRHDESTAEWATRLLKQHRKEAQR